MFKENILLILASLLLLSCNNDCEDDPPMPIGFRLQWIDSLERDFYSVSDVKPDSLIAFYIKNRRNQPIYIPLKVEKYKTDTTEHYIDVMPLIREIYSLQIDTMYIGPSRDDIDTLVVELVKDENDCFSTIYNFEKLEYNGIPLSSDDNIYIIEK